MDFGRARLATVTGFVDYVRAEAGELLSQDGDGRVGNAQRWVAIVGGGLLAAYGLKQKSISGAALAVAGGYLVYAGASAERPFSDGVEAVTGPLEVKRTVSINRPAAELYAFWRNPENLPKFMLNIESVTRIGQTRTHWVTRPVMGIQYEWDGEVTQNVENERIAWRSVSDSHFENSGSVTFAPATQGRGTEVTLELSYKPPMGRLGVAVATFIGQDQERQIREILRQFKQLMDAGEIPSTVGQPFGRRYAPDNLLEGSLGANSRTK